MTFGVFISELNTEPVPRIPIRNLWLLMAYAADIDTPLYSSKVASQDFEDNVIDIIAELLAAEVKKMLNFGLTFGYEPISGELSRLRGKIDHLKTARFNSSSRGKIFCTYERFSNNTPENQLVRTSLHRIGKHVVDPKLKNSCKTLEVHLGSMGIDVFKHPRITLHVQNQSRNRRYSYLLSLAELAMNLDLLSERDGIENLMSPERKIEWIRKLFEKAMGGFYRHHLDGSLWRVESGKKRQWPKTNATPGLSAILPSMITDIEISNSKERKKIIVDTKFTSIVKDGYFRKSTLNSGHIYQLYTYLRTSEDTDAEYFDSSIGLLLYPSHGESLYEEAMIQNHKCVFATVDLFAEPREIRNELLNLFGRLHNSTSASL